MELRINGNESYYFSNSAYKNDSLIMDSHRKKITLVRTAPNEPLLTDRILKDYINPNEIKSVVNLNTTKYSVIDDRKMDWKIMPETDNFLGYRIQKAITNFAGRNWIAWFTKEIPINDGPYKFKGLPGLIIKIQDSKNQHSFTLSGIKNSSSNFQYPTTEIERGILSLNQSDFEKLYKNYRSNPVADLEGKIPDQPDQYGNMRTGSEILREFKEKEIKRISKENNLIEIDLLKL